MGNSGGSQFTATANWDRPHGRAALPRGRLRLERRIDLLLALFRRLGLAHGLNRSGVVGGRVAARPSRGGASRPRRAAWEGRAPSRPSFVEIGGRCRSGTSPESHAPLKSQARIFRVSPHPDDTERGAEHRPRPCFYWASKKSEIFCAQGADCRRQTTARRDASPHHRVLRNAVIAGGWLKRRQDGGSPCGRAGARLSRCGR